MGWNFQLFVRDGAEGVDFQPIYKHNNEPKVAKYFVLQNGLFPNAHKIIRRRVYILEREMGSFIQKRTKIYRRKLSPHSLQRYMSRAPAELIIHSFLKIKLQQQVGKMTGSSTTLIDDTQIYFSWLTWRYLWSRFHNRETVVILFRPLEFRWTKRMNFMLGAHSQLLKVDSR
jgi:hypothetical protein